MRLTFWFEYASTYSHLSAQRIAPLAARAGVEVIWRPFLLGPIFKAMGWDSSPFVSYPAKGAYMWRDLARRADWLGLEPIKLPPGPMPQHSLLAARIGTIGIGAGWVPEFSRALYRAQFVAGQNIAHDDTLLACLSTIGVDAGPVLERAKTDTQIKDTLRQHSAQAIDLGLFGAPSFTTQDGELFWGDDRLEDALAWAARPHAKA